MSFRTYMTRIRRLDSMIRSKSTGPPEELAEKLDISERWLYKFLRELKEEFDCPITYYTYRQSYVYEEQGKMIVGFETIPQTEKRRINGGFLKKNARCIYLFSNG